MNDAPYHLRRGRSRTEGGEGLSVKKDYAIVSGQPVVAVKVTCNAFNDAQIEPGHLRMKRHLLSVDMV